MTLINNHTQHQDGLPQFSHTRQPQTETFQITDKQLKSDQISFVTQRVFFKASF